MATTNAALRKRVERGVALLDEKKPGWCERISLRKLSLSSGDHCILGQLYRPHSRQTYNSPNGFEAGLRILRIDEEGAPWEHGFDLSPTEHTPMWRRLELAWRQAIEDRC